METPAPMSKRIVLIVSALPFLLAAIGFGALLSSPWTGMGLEWKGGGWVLTSVAHGSPSIALEDLLGSPLVSIAGHKPGEFDLVEDFDYVPTKEALVGFLSFQRLLAEEARVGNPLRLEFSTPAGLEARILVPRGFPLRVAFARVWLMYFLGLSSLLLGASLLWIRPADRRAASFFWMSLSVAGIFVTFGSYTARETAFPAAVFDLLRWANVISFASFPALFLYFCLNFPGPRKILRYKATKFILAAAPIVITPIYQLRLSYDLLSWYFLAALVTGVIVVLLGLFTVKTAIERYQVLWVLAGLSVFAFVFLATTILPLILNEHRLVSDRVPSFFFIAVPLSVVLAIARYRLMDVEAIFGWFLVYIPTLAIIGAIDVAAISFLGNFLEFRGEGPGSLAFVLILWTSLLAYIPLRDALRRGMERFFKKTSPDPQELLIGYGDRLALIDDTEFWGETLKVFAAGFESAEAIALPVGAEQVRQGSSAPLPFDAETGRILARPTLAYEIPGLADSALPLSWQSGLVIPLRSATTYFGCLVLGPKWRRRMYSRREMAVSAAMTRIGSAFLERARIQREAREEKERLSREIHDSLAGSLSNALMMVARLTKGKAENPDPRNAELENLSEFLSERLGETRDLMWGIEEDENSLADLASLLRRKVRQTPGIGESASIHQPALEHPERRLPPVFRINVLRIVQELVTNSIKHGGAPFIEFELREEGGQFIARLGDKGPGFDPRGTKGGHGLRNMRLRAAELGGTVDFASAEGGGTTALLRVPLPPEP